MSDAESRRNQVNNFVAVTRRRLYRARRSLTAGFGSSEVDDDFCKRSKHAAVYYHVTRSLIYSFVGGVLHPHRSDSLLSRVSALPSLCETVSIRSFRTFIIYSQNGLLLSPFLFLFFAFFWRQEKTTPSSASLNRGSGVFRSLPVPSLTLNFPYLHGLQLVCSIHASCFVLFRQIPGQ